MGIYDCLDTSNVRYKMANMLEWDVVSSLLASAEVTWESIVW